MSWEEQQILDFLATSPDSFFARREISRKAVKRRYLEENPEWVTAPLEALVQKRLVQQDAAGYYGYVKPYD
jgi:hypothetical protein